jgi:hypothetical protein
MECIFCCLDSFFQVWEKPASGGQLLRSETSQESIISGNNNTFSVDAVLS